jgi:hypothetical protein
MTHLITRQHHATGTAALSSTLTPARTIQHLVPHIRQQLRWECGLASTVSILHAVHPHAHAHKPPLHTDDTCHCSPLPTIDELRAAVEHCEQSIWTIDLLYLLHRYLPPSTPLTFHTTATGCDIAKYQSTLFYAHVNRDAARVNSLFAAAQAAGLRVIAERVELDTIVELLASNHILLVLMDARRMHCVKCAVQNSTLTSTDHESWHREHYAGHYVIVNGITADRSRYLYVNADADTPQCSVAVHALEKARAAPGTDDDIIVVGLKPATG